MRIYFTASIVGKKQYLSYYKAIIEQLSHMGHTVIADHIMQTTEEQLTLETKEERRKFHKKLHSWITESDCVIVEASFPSISVGYEIALALNSGKAVLVLHTEGDPPSLLPELNAERLVIEKYSIASLHSILHDFLLYAQGSDDARFTFFLTHRQAFHLTSASKKVGLPKAVYLRNLIDQDIRNNQ